MSAEGPYRKDGGFAEKEDIKKLSDDIVSMNGSMRGRISILFFMFLTAFIFLGLLGIEYVTDANKSLVHHEESIERISTIQASYQVKRIECNNRRQFMLKQQERSAECADVCIEFLNGFSPRIMGESRYSSSDCYSCLIIVATPMSFEIAYPDYGDIR
jgi:hypothetical protein